MDQRKSLTLLSALAITACTTVPDKPAWVEGEEIRGFFSLGCLQKDDGAYQSKYFSLEKDNVQMTLIYGKDNPCRGKAGVIIAMKRKTPKTHWISEQEFIWGMAKAGEGFLMVSPGENARLVLQQAGNDVSLSEVEKAAAVETGIVPVPLVQDLCYWKGRLSEDGRGFALMQAATEKGCFASFDDAKMANNAWGPIHEWKEKDKNSQSADELFEEAETQYKAALLRHTPAG
jgi:hypothetical protein